MFNRRNLAWLIIVLALLATACEASTMAEIRGPAKIHFGHTFSEEGFSLIDETTEFHLADEIKMLVDFGVPPMTTRLDRMVSRIEGEFESVVDRRSFNLPTGKGSMIRWTFIPSYYSLGLGHYRLRILKDETVLAEGDFELIE